MAKEDFINLFEIQSLITSIQQIDISIENENNRIIKLEKKERNTQETLLQNKSELKQLKSEITENENQLSSLELKLSKNEQHLKTVSSEKQLSSLQLELKSLLFSKEKLESKIFSQMETEENIQEQIKQYQTFLLGLPNSIIDIRNDVKELNSVQLKEKKIKESQIKNLEEQIEDKFIKTYNSILGKIIHKKKSSKSLALGFIDGNKCALCKFQVSAQVSHTIESGQVIELCPECGCLLAPSSAKLIL